MRGGFQPRLVAVRPPSPDPRDLRLSYRGGRGRAALSGPKGRQRLEGRGPLVFPGVLRGRRQANPSPATVGGYQGQGAGG